MAKNRLAIIMAGGNIVSLFTDDPELEIIFADWDDVLEDTEYQYTTDGLEPERLKALEMSEALHALELDISLQLQQNAEKEKTDDQHSKSTGSGGVVRN
jgi:hypothetical protein